MKYLVIFILFLGGFQTYAQSDAVLDFAEVVPQFPGGEKAMNTFINNNLVYPKQCRERGESGTVYIQIVVYKDGSIGDFKVMRKTNIALDDEALRVVKLMPNWIPGEVKGKKVNVRYMIPISFQIVEGPKTKKELREEKKREKDLLKHNK